MNYCRHGHAFDEANTYYSPDGWRRCRACHRERVRSRYEAHPRPEVSDIDRFLEKLVFSDDTDCIIWVGTLTKEGYGQFWHATPGLTQRAHRWLWQYVNGPLSDDLDLDHVRERGCTSRACVNPAHLEPVTPRVNILRGTGVAPVNARKTHCPRGHEYAGANLYVSPQGKRDCVICRRARKARYLEKATA